MARIHNGAYSTNKLKYTAKGAADVLICFDNMVQVCCCPPGFSNRSDCNTSCTYHCLPLKNQPLLHVWNHRIGQSNLLLKLNRRICSDHIVNSRDCKVRVDEYSTLGLPK